MIGYANALRGPVDPDVTGTGLEEVDVVRDIDAMLRQVAYTGWTDSRPGDREVRKELRGVLNTCSLPLAGLLFDHAYVYVRENY